MDPSSNSGILKQPPASWREKVLIIFILVLMCAGVYILLYPPPWLWYLKATPSAGRVIPDPVLGNPEAELKIIVYNDFACGKCLEWYRSGVEEKILQKYGERVAFVWRDLPLTSRYASRAAEAAQCANDQGRFWEYRDYLYDIGQGFMDEKLIEYAGNLGLDVKKFDQCLIGGEMEAKLADSQANAYKDRVQAVPTFFIAGERIVGPASLEGMSRLIDDALNMQ